MSYNLKRVTILILFAGLLVILIAGNKNTVKASADTSHEKEDFRLSTPDEWETKLTAKVPYPKWEKETAAKADIDFVEDVKQESKVRRSLRFRQDKIGYNDIKKPVLKLDGTSITTDNYKPVRFMMREHSVRMEGDCASCHHKTPAQAIKGKTPRDLETISCEACHQSSISHESETDRLSLKAAYHDKCISCHETKNSDKAPVNCTGCHQKNIPNHEDFFTVEGEPEKVKPRQITALCLECHPKAGEEMVKSAHYKWSGPVSEWTELSSSHTTTGKVNNAINNNCISPFADWSACTKCHVGYGLRDESGKFADEPMNVDCLACHAAEDTYAKSKNGMPEDDVDLVWTAGMVGSPGRSNCGACHYKAGGGNGRKGTLYNALNEPDRSLDVHMGGEFNMSCADCHKTKQHKIPGRHSSVGVDEGIVECTDCHSPKPHAGKDLGKHIDRHVDAVECSTCHVPTYSREQWTRSHWDWRAVGKGDKIIKDKVSGKPIFLPDEGIFKWDKNVKPFYSWDNGHTKRYLIGDKIEDMNQPVQLSRNLGSYEDPLSKIGPFKLFTGWQPADKEYQYLLVPKNTGEEGIWESKKWEGALHAGMEDVDLPFSGEFTFVETELRFRPRHEVAPKEDALTCVQCHSDTLASATQAEANCIRCHKETKPGQIKKMIKKGKGKALNNFDWNQLGYKDDPVITGGRFRQ